MDKFKNSRFLPFNNVFQQAGVLTALMSVLLLTATPASAHHATGGKMPSNFFEGFMAGMAHPLIGLDHFAFIVAIGLLSSLLKSLQLYFLFLAAIKVSADAEHDLI